MERLFAITYADPDRAKQAMESVDWSDFERLVHVKAACWITNENGELSVHPRGHPVAGKAFVGGALGLLVGGLFAIPVAGIAVGALGAIHRAKKEDLGIDDAFLTSIKSEIETGGSAIVILFEEGADNQRAARDLAKFGGTVHSVDLSPDVLTRFQTLLDQAEQGTQASGSNEASG
jgi:uncharacterized membrane protein